MLCALHTSARTSPFAALARHWQPPTAEARDTHAQLDWLVVSNRQNELLALVFESLLRRYSVSIVSHLVGCFTLVNGFFLSLRWKNRNFDDYMKYIRFRFRVLRNYILSLRVI